MYMAYIFLLSIASSNHIDGRVQSANSGASGASATFDIEYTCYSAIGT